MCPSSISKERTAAAGMNPGNMSSSMLAGFGQPHLGEPERLDYTGPPPFPEITNLEHYDRHT